jgi:N-acyl-D-amino-acid deacylase
LHTPRTLLKGGIVHDGSGSPGARADVLLEGETIAAIGPELRAEGAEVMDAGGMVVCPGFIDIHNHTREGADCPVDEASRQVVPVAWQGITTLVAGMDGFGDIDIARFASKTRAHPWSANVARLVGHTAVREAVIGREDRPARPEELEKMAALVQAGMQAGAFGLSTGLEYLGDWVTTDEVTACARAIAPFGGYYETHLRNEDVGVFDAAREAIRICREAGGIPLSVSHIKVGSAEVWRQAGRLLDILGEARAAGMAAYANWRPSVCWQSTLTVLDADGRKDPGAVDRELRTYWPRADAYCFSCRSHPEVAGRTLDGIAASWDVSPAEALLRLWRYGDALFEYNAMTWEDKETFLRDPFCMVTSDGGDVGDRSDPMIWGCFPIFLGLNRRNGWLPLEAAIHKCTALPARLLGLTDRGLLAPGLKADVAVFDPDAVCGETHWDRADTQPTGIRAVFVNGVKVMDAGAHTGALPGRMLLRGR